MAIIKAFFVISFTTMILSCSSNDNAILSLNKTEIPFVEDSNSYIINVDNSQVRLISDTLLQKTEVVFDDNKRIFLDIYVIPPYLTGAYECEMQDFGKVLILESAVVGASGLSSNITNVNIIFLSKKYFGNVMSYNSFYGGIDLLKYQGKELLLSIYNYDGITSTGNMIYCRTVFKFTPNGFVQEQSSKNGFIHDKNGKLINSDNCEC